jgi:hypothetical protein
VVVGKEDKGVVASKSVDAAGTEGDMTSVVGTSTVLAPGGGVKKMTPPAAGTVDESGMVDTPGLFGDGSAAGSGDGSGDGASGELVGGATADEGSESSESPASSAAASKAESVRRSTAMALGLPTAILR